MCSIVKEAIKSKKFSLISPVPILFCYTPQEVLFIENAPHQEVSKIVEIAVLLVFNVDDSPFVLSASDRFAIYNDVALTSYYSKGNEGLFWKGYKESLSAKHSQRYITEVCLTLIASFNWVSSWS